jgi:hypothetical protein
MCRIPPIPPINDIREPFRFPGEDHLATLSPYHPPMETLPLPKEVAALLISIDKQGE